MGRLTEMIDYLDSSKPKEYIHFNVTSKAKKFKSWYNGNSELSFKEYEKKSLIEKQKREAKKL